VSLGKNFEAFCKTIAALRHPKTGCPWDLKQTHKSLRKYMVEEAYEAVDAMGRNDAREICEELGDVLLQVVLNAQLAKDEKKFEIADVIESINSKMLRRHPHVFGKSKSREISAIRQEWENIKAEEKKKKGEREQNISAHAKKYKMLPGLMESVKIGSLMNKVGFDWNKISDVVGQVDEEFSELKAEIKKKNARKAQMEEMGDLLFSIAQLCRHLEIDPEVAMKQANGKFLKRFATMEKLNTKSGVAFENLTLEKKEVLWNKAKLLEKSRG